MAAAVRIVGVDLVEPVGPVDLPPGVELEAASVTSWSPTADSRFDLITCVHGFHYVGDKLGLLARVASWLADEGTFVANLDLRSIRLSDGRPAGRGLGRCLKANGFNYDVAHRRIRRRGRLGFVGSLPLPRCRRPRGPTTRASRPSSRTTSRCPGSRVPSRRLLRPGRGPAPPSEARGPGSGSLRPRRAREASSPR